MTRLYATNMPRSAYNNGFITWFLQFYYVYETWKEAEFSYGSFIQLNTVQLKGTGLGKLLRSRNVNLVGLIKTKWGFIWIASIQTK